MELFRLDDLDGIVFREKSHTNHHVQETTPGTFSVDVLGDWLETGFCCFCYKITWQPFYDVVHLRYLNTALTSFSWLSLVMRVILLLNSFNTSGNMGATTQALMFYKLFTGSFGAVFDITADVASTDGLMVALFCYCCRNPPREFHRCACVGLCVCSGYVSLFLLCLKFSRIETSLTSFV